ncbi:MAG: hypothetical protein ABIF11_11410 [Nitrospirota bacterium]
MINIIIVAVSISVISALTLFLLSLMVKVRINNRIRFATWSCPKCGKTTRKGFFCRKCLMAEIEMLREQNTVSSMSY